MSPLRARLLTALFAGSALLSACTGPTYGREGLRFPTPTPAAPALIQEADKLFFTNRYADAGREYQRAISAYPRDARAHAHFALFLNYLQLQGAALQEAQRAVSLAPQDPYVLTVITRVLDWASRFDDAVQFGERAVQAAPTSALAHAFYGEALADLSRFEEARGELRRADSLLGSAGSSDYEKAEVARNWANFYRAQDDRANAVRQLERAVEAQPGFAERLLELARTYIAQNDLAHASEYLQRSANLLPKDTRLREQVGEVALIGSDYNTAKRAFEAALALPGYRAEDRRVLAHIAIARDRDLPAAERYLDEALDRNPSDAEAAAYLLGIYRYLRGDEATAQAIARGEPAEPQVHPRAAPEYPDLDQVQLQEEQDALASVNRYRALAGLPPVSADARLHQSAQAHAYYFLFNAASPETAGLGIHRETPGAPAFTGQTVGDRARYFGLTGQPVLEDITHRGNTPGAVGDWINSVYHRFPILRRDLVSLGFGSSGAGPLSVEVMDFAYATAFTSGRNMVAYPGPGQPDVPTAFFGNELPDPVPGGPYPTGYPITLTFDSGARVEIQSNHVRTAAGDELELHVLRPSDANMQNSLALLPKRPLQPGARYTVDVGGIVNGAPFAKHWEFTTGIPLRRLPRAQADPTPFVTTLL
jgi:tetratricopeptide (TPR) repeat protein